ncbi:cysteine proteinase [Marasmius fiardii PR-910]|nr:cysteine proteinase [Marasmius fiardii PR-910]
MAESLDLVGGPFAVVESDPGVFTSLIRHLGIKNIELIELYDIEPWAVDHLDPHGLIFCFSWKKDKDSQDHRPKADDFQNDPIEQVWFANQLSDDACASLAILNVLLNCDRDKVDVGEELASFREETKDMSAVMRGLAVSSSHLIRKAHNSLARPADLRGAQNTVVLTSLSAQKKASKTTTTKPSQQKTKRNKASTKTSPKQPKKKEEKEVEDEEAYHFIGYVSAYGKVWELDGFKSDPLEVGELPSNSSSSSSNTANWMDIVRPALRMKMAKYGDEGGGRFSLLAVVDGLYEKASDEWEFWKKERKVVERRLGEIDPDWGTKVGVFSSLVQLTRMLTLFPEQVDRTLLHSAEEACILSASFSTLVPAPTTQKTFAPSGSRRLEADVKILHQTDAQELIKMYEKAVKECLSAKIAVEDELTKGKACQIDHIKRTHDYEPFLCEFVQCLHNEGLVDVLIDSPAVKSKQTAVGKAEKAVSSTNGRGRPRKKAKLDEDDGDGGNWKP